MSDKARSNGPTPPGTRSGAARRSAPAARTATPRRSPSGSAACRAIPTSRASTSASCPRSWPSRSAGQTPKMIFVNSMSDLFHEGRARRLHRSRRPGDGAGELAHLPGADQAVRADARPAPDQAARSPPSSPHIWWGVSVENRKHGLPRIEHLRAAPAAAYASCRSSRCSKTWATIDLTGIHWVIVGGESGPGAGRCRSEWVLVASRPVPAAGRPVLLQAVGRSSQAFNWTGPRWDESTTSFQKE